MTRQEEILAELKACGATAVIVSFKNETMVAMGDSNELIAEAAASALDKVTDGELSRRIAGWLRYSKLRAATHGMQSTVVVSQLVNGEWKRVQDIDDLELELPCPHR